jgi:hypothetical protein
LVGVYTTLICIFIRHSAAAVNYLPTQSSPNMDIIPISKVMLAPDCEGFQLHVTAVKLDSDEKGVANVK